MLQVQLYPVPHISKTSNNRRRKGSTPKFSTSSPYKLDLEKSIKRKEETELPKRKRTMIKELRMQKKTVKPKKKIESKKKQKSTQEVPKKKMESPRNIQNKPSTSKEIINTESVLNEISQLLQNDKSKKVRIEGTKQKTAPKRKSKNIAKKITQKEEKNNKESSVFQFRSQ